VHWYGVCFFLRGRFVCLHVQLISTVQSATVHNMHASCFTGVWMHTYVPSDPSPAKQNVKRRCQMISCVRYVVALVPSSSTCSDTNKCITVFSLKKNVSLWQHACMINCTKSRALVRACMQISMCSRPPPTCQPVYNGNWSFGCFVGGHRGNEKVQMPMQAQGQLSHSPEPLSTVRSKCRRNGVREKKSSSEGM